MIRGKYLNSTDDLSVLFDIRSRVEEFGVGSQPDRHDKMAVYALIFDEQDTPCGCGRLYIDDDSHFRIDTLGVLATHRRVHIGDLIARMLLYRAQMLNAGSVYADVPDDVMPFFSRYGFVCGEVCENVCGRPAHRMTVPGDGIRLEGSCSKGKNGCSGNCADCGS